MIGNVVGCLTICMKSFLLSIMLGYHCQVSSFVVFNSFKNLKALNRERKREVHTAHNIYCLHTCMYELITLLLTGPSQADLRGQRCREQDAKATVAIGHTIFRGGHQGQIEGPWPPCRPVKFLPWFEHNTDDLSRCSRSLF